MKSPKLLALILLAVTMLTASFLTRSAESERPSGNIDRGERTNQGSGGRGITEAPTGFDNLSNGFDEQGPDFETLNEDNVVPLRSFNDNRFIFEEVETVDDGLGPTFNGQSCGECHQHTVTGGVSPIAELRAGHLEQGTFIEALGGSLVHTQATFPAIDRGASGI